MTRRLFVGKPAVVEDGRELLANTLCRSMVAPSLGKVRKAKRIAAALSGELTADVRQLLGDVTG